MSKHTVYVYAEHTSRAGSVYQGDPEGTEDNADLVFAFEGTEESIIAEAQKELTIRYDTRPGGAGDAFRCKCAREVLAHLGADEE